MKGCDRRLGLLETSVLFCLFVAEPTAAQIVPDATLPNNSTVNLQGTRSVIEGGTTSGGNLFHSFREFSVPTGGEAFFNNTGDIQNIFSRVTGGNISNIDGLIRANGTANLFLLNPNGIIFGPNAMLNIGGSFLASTASGFRFADGTIFSATNPQAAPLLTISVPIGLQMGTNSGSIVNRANAVTNSDGFPLGLQVPTGRSIALVGGDVVLEGGGLNAPGGRIELGGLAVDGTIGLAVEGNTLRLNFPFVGAIPPWLPLRANVTLANDARVSVRDAGGGDIVVNANNLTATNGGRLVAGTEGLGNAGDIIVNANNISLSGVGASEVESGFSNQVISGASGNGGNIFVNTGSLSLTNGAQLSTDTDGLGKGGNISIVARGNVSLFGKDTAIFSDVNRGAIAQGGNISIQAETVSIFDRAKLSASTYGQGNAGSILVQANGAISFDNNVILSKVGSVAEGNGGNITIAASSLSLTNGAQIQTDINEASETRPGGRGNAGNVRIDVRDAVTIAGGNKDGFGTGILSDVGAGAVGNGGDINITAGSLSLTDGAQLVTGVGGTFNSFPGGRGNAGNVNINVRDAVTIIGGNKEPSSAVLSILRSGAVGNGGNINITAGSVSFTDGAQLAAGTEGQGNGGNISVQAIGSVSLSNNSGFISDVQSGAVGNGGNITIRAGSLSLIDGGQIVTVVRKASETLPAGRGNGGNITIGVRDTVTMTGGSSYVIRSGLFTTVEAGAIGNGGDIDIQAGSLSMTNGANVSASTLGQGNGGNIFIGVSSLISLEGGLVTPEGGVIPILISSTVLPGAVGNGGNIKIEAGLLSLTNFASIDANTAGLGNGGNISVQVRDSLSLTEDGASISSIVAPATDLGQGGVGNGGKIEIQAGLLFLTGRASISASNLGGKGDAGSISLQVDDSVSLANDSFISTTVNREAVGKGGDINIMAGSLFLTNRGSLFAGTLGQGDSGSISVQVDGSVSLAGSFVSTSVSSPGVGKGGDINIKAGSLSLTDGAGLSAGTSAQGDAGNISVQVDDSVSLAGTGSSITTSVFSGGVGKGGDINIRANSFLTTSGSFFSATTFGQGKAGNIAIEARDTISFDGGSAFSTEEATANGNGGTIRLTAPTLSLTNSSRVSVTSVGPTGAGNIEVDAGSVRLDNSFLAAETVAGDRGNIEVRSSSLILRNSDINTDARGAATGGNINLDTDVLAALNNSDIRANAEQAAGGRVTINTQAIFGAQPRTREELQTLLNINDPNQLNPGLLPTSDITAISQQGGPDLQGTVGINTPDVDPSSGLIELPANFVDITGQIVQDCPTGTRFADNEFFITGRGGIPPTPREALSHNAIEVDWVTPTPNPQVQEGRGAGEQGGRGAGKPPIPTEIVEATGWVRGANGEIILTANPPTATPYETWYRSILCPAPRPNN
ncbi:two-partner secretion domain-containing protein [Microseira wollei]|uniref:Filamentous hemagglutinin outer membrane protein n=1 Tax=Microseira wollei NIES-4236 TaxID=2530354 RepID=A0AAV3XRL7_9CYAN|nr:filamentous hemagglutinin N-terminal domain-containing protein [Microseira wollei]GET43267.1 filamentous hemagglutinin outer membrane protein [Microseira wollei NIES-4236]